MPKSTLPARYRTRRRWTVTEARAVLGALASSGLRPRVFAEREGLDVQRITRWRRQLEAEVAEAPEFVELRPRAAEPVEIVLRSGRVLRVSEWINVAVLLHLVEALEQGGSC